MTCRSQLAQAIRDLPANAPRSMASIQSSIVSYFEAHQISKFIAYAMSTGNWSTNAHPGHAAGNSMAAAVAVKTGVILSEHTIFFRFKHKTHFITMHLVCSGFNN